MITNYDLIENMLQTEKGSANVKYRQYFFRVNPGANKTEIKKAVETAYKVKVQSVNVLNVPGKLKKVRTRYGYTSDWKKAVVTLKSGNKIEVA